jgi:hypothetical protein
MTQNKANRKVNKKLDEIAYFVHNTVPIELYISNSYAYHKLYNISFKRKYNRNIQ